VHRVISKKVYKYKLIFCSAYLLSYHSRIPASATSPVDLIAIRQYDPFKGDPSLKAFESFVTIKQMHGVVE
jgi:hypothetical protein